MNDFVTSSIGHLEDFRSMIYADHPDVGMFHSTIPRKAKSCLLMIPPVFPRRCPTSKWEAVELTAADTASPECPFFTWKLKCIIGNKSHQLFSLKQQTHIIQFGQNIFQTPKSENSRFFGFSVFYFKRQLRPTRACAWETTVCSMWRKCSVCPCFTTQETKKTCTRGARVNQNTLGCTIKDILRRKGFCPGAEVWLTLLLTWCGRGG